MGTSIPSFKTIHQPRDSVDWTSAKSYLTDVSESQMEPSITEPDINGDSPLDELSFPQAIAHRGYQSQYPENTMLAFTSAINVGAHAIETDLHVTRDNVVVLSHDPTLLRCFGVEKRIRDCDMSYIQTLRTVKQPSQVMPTLKELLTLFRQPEVLHMWLMLDVKMDNDPDLILQLTSEVLEEVGGGGAEVWGGRIVLGIWALKYIPLCDRYLPGFPITHIGASIAYARQFLRIPGISFNIHHAILANEAGLKFIRDAQAAGRDVYTWTVKDIRIMKWSMCQRINGVCVDDPPDYFRMSLEYTPAWDSEPFWGWKKDMELRSIRLVAWIFVFLMRWKFSGGIRVTSMENELIQQRIEASSRRIVEPYSDNPVGGQ